MTILYRVENEYGLGPYAAEVSGLRAGDSPSRPLPENDGIEDGMYDHERAAFASLDQVVDWFDSAALLDHLREEGFSVYAVDVPNVWIRFGERQVVFDFDPAEPDTQWRVSWAEIKKLHREKIRR